MICGTDTYIVHCYPAYIILIILCKTWWLKSIIMMRNSVPLTSSKLTAYMLTVKKLVNKI